MHFVKDFLEVVIPFRNCGGLDKKPYVVRSVLTWLQQCRNLVMLDERFVRTHAEAKHGAS